MKKLLYILAFFSTLSFSACDPWQLDLQDFPSVETLNLFPGDLPTDLLAEGEISGLTDQGTIEQHGHIWAFEADQLTIEQAQGQTTFQRRGNGRFTSKLEDITPGRTIFVRAYIVYQNQVRYGQVLSINTADLGITLVVDTLELIKTDVEGSIIMVKGLIRNLPVGLPISDYGIFYETNPASNVSEATILSNGRTYTTSDQIEFSTEIINLKPDRYHFSVFLKVGEAAFYSESVPLSIGNFWVKKLNFPDLGYFTAHVFSLGRTAWFFGQNELGVPVYKYDPDKDHWNLVNSLTSPFFREPIVANVDDKIYLGLDTEYKISAIDPIPFRFHHEIYVFDPVFETLTEITSFPVEDSLLAPGQSPDQIEFPGLFPFAFGMNGLLYVGFGGEARDFWSYEPALDKWTQLPDLPATFGQYNRLVFTVEESAYLVDNQLMLWQYNPLSGIWNPLKKVPLDPPSGDPIGNEIFSGFAIGESLFFQNYTTQVVEYIIPSHEFVVRADYPGRVELGQISFAIGDRAFRAFGIFPAYIAGSNTFDYYNHEVWEYIPQK